MHHARNRWLRSSPTAPRLCEYVLQRPTLGWS